MALSEVAISQGPERISADHALTQLKAMEISPGDRFFTDSTHVYGWGISVRNGKQIVHLWRVRIGDDGIDVVDEPDFGNQEDIAKLLHDVWEEGGFAFD